MQFRFREPVILAADFSSLVGWYQDVLGFKVVNLFEEDFHYCNLESASGMKIGITDAVEMGVEPDDLQKFFTHVKQNGASTTDGPSFDKKGNFWFGSFTDPEGNPFWTVDKNCP